MPKKTTNYVVTIADAINSNQNRQVLLQLPREEVRYLNQAEFKKFVADKCQVSTFKIHSIERFYK